jgi:hypothetical protein
LDWTDEWTAFLISVQFNRNDHLLWAIETMRRRPIIQMTEPDTHNSTAEVGNSILDLDDPELCVEQQSLLYASSTAASNRNSKDKPHMHNLLQSYRGRRRLFVLAVAVAVTLGVVVFTGGRDNSKETAEGTLLMLMVVEGLRLLYRTVCMYVCM